MWTKRYSVRSASTTSRIWALCLLSIPGKQTPQLPGISHSTTHGVLSPDRPHKYPENESLSHRQTPHTVNMKVKTYCCLLVQETQPLDHSILCSPLSARVNQLFKSRETDLCEKKKINQLHKSQVSHIVTLFILLSLTPGPWTQE